MVNNAVSDKFNYLIFIFSLGLLISIFSRFTMSPGIYAALFLLFFIVFIFHINVSKIYFNSFYIPLLCFALIIIFSYYIGDFKYNIRNNLLLFTPCFIIYILSGFLSESDKKATMLMPIFIGLWLTIFLFSTNFAFSQFLENQPITKDMVGTSSFLILALSASFIFWWTEKKTYVYTSLVLFFAIIMTKHFFAISVASLLFASFLFFMREKIKFKTILTVSPFIILFVISSYMFIKMSYFEGVLISWKTALSIIKDNFIFGVGFGNYEAVSLQYSFIEGFDISGADNIFFQVFAETGILGFIAFILMLLVFFYNINKKLKNKEQRYLYIPVLISVTAFLLFNSFSSAAFSSTNILMFFMLLAFPMNSFQVYSRKPKINTYLLIILILPLAISIGKPIYAHQEYKKGISSLTAGGFNIARDHFFNALNNDPVNPEYSNIISELYFALYKEKNNTVLLDIAIEYEKSAHILNKFNAKYYYQLAWLYNFKEERELASEYISKALDMDKFNPLYYDAYGELIY